MDYTDLKCKDRYQLVVAEILSVKGSEELVMYLAGYVDSSSHCR